MHELDAAFEPLQAALALSQNTFVPEDVWCVRRRIKCEEEGGKGHI
jgi:hypothetical protein